MAEAITKHFQYWACIARQAGLHVPCVSTWAQCPAGRCLLAGGTVTRDAGPVKGGSTEIAFVEVSVYHARDHQRLQQLAAPSHCTHTACLLRDTL